MPAPALGSLAAKTRTSGGVGFPMVMKCRGHGAPNGVWVRFAEFYPNPTDSNDRHMNSETNGKTWMCLICGLIYDEAMGLPAEGIPPGTRWEDVPMNWVCPECGARKSDFEMVEF